MKIGIVTLIGEYNYGNLLQSYALQTVLERMGHNPITLNRRVKSPTIKLYFLRILSFIRSFVARYILKRDNRLIINPFIEDYNPRYYADKNELIRFVKENIHRTEPLRSTQSMQVYVKNESFDAMIVGSDQVWREDYVFSIEEMFFSFLPYDSKIKRIAYAGSFGTDDGFISQAKIPTCINLLKKFNAISVREKSAVDICERFFGTKAEHVLDPTMLLNTEDYKRLFNKDSILKSEGDLLVYILDNTDEIKMTIESLAGQYNLTPFTVNAIEIHNEKSYNYKFLSVESWLRGFYDAEFIITDSFHACVFSILFNKPFVCIGNKGRGNARFDSLLGMFGLENRLVDDMSRISGMMNEPINWAIVNSTLEGKKIESIAFLENALKS